MPKVIYTIGHSSLELPEFLAALGRQEIEVLCDVRSRPGSYRHPQFNREPLEACLREAKLRYEFLGESLGGRPEDPRAYYSDGRVNYEERRRARDFQTEVDRLLTLSAENRVALMCAEEDPLQCHRFLMICPALVERGIAPIHIRKSGELESQSEAEDRLLKLHDLAAFDSGSLFPFEREQAVRDALRLQAQEFAFRVSAEALESY
ncbi:MAG TPA: DUF488 domain-containing protein [Candidatus Acidoferrum sp.]|nr:DUF488 domain-containing protein [Candidatus Acidoferrum sp.]